MKILQVGLGNNPGGMEAFVMNYFRELARQGVSFDFVSMYGTIAYEKEILDLGGRVFYVPNIKKDYFGYIKAFRKLLSREKYDVVHVNMLSAANIVPLRLAKQAGVRKVIAHSHNASAPGIVRKLMDGVNRPRMKHYVNEKFACSEKAGRWLFGDKAFERGEVTLVANAIETDKSNPLLPLKKSLAPPREYSGYEYELYHVRKQQNASNRRPVGLRPAGRFLSIFADCHFRQKIRWKRRRSADQGQHRPLTTDRIILLTPHGKGVRR